MNTTKPWWRSRTVWAAAVSVLAGLLGLAGLNLDATLQDELVNLLTGAAEIGAGIMAFIGRFQASTTLTWRAA